MAARSSSGKRKAPWLRVMGILATLGLVAGFAELSPAGARWNAPVAQAQDEAATYEEELAKGQLLLRRHRFEEALKSFKRANQLKDKQSAESFIWMAQAYKGLEAYKNVIESADKAIEFGGGDSKIGAQAYNLKGLALQAQSENKNQKKLQEAEAAFRQGVALNANLIILHYNLGYVLMQQNRDAEGAAEMQKYLALDSKSESAELARKVIENPRRAREPFAPDFSVTTSEGEFIELADLKGKVVVLDFWGTWCPPCVASVPSLRSLHKRFSKDPAFVMIGISVRDEDERWRAFIAENKMVWHQFRDKENQVQRAFAINAFPTYLVIDHEGIIRYRNTGMSSEASLEDAISKQLKRAAKTAPSD
ncbi:MAG: redoxin domain-containing protein [Pyrinomonadaceae bacterium]